MTKFREHPSTTCSTLWMDRFALTRGETTLLKVRRTARLKSLSWKLTSSFHTDGIYPASENCGVAPLSNVISTSYGYNEGESSTVSQGRRCLSCAQAASPPEPS